jgi:hypothetical protein
MSRRWPVRHACTTEVASYMEAMYPQNVGGKRYEGEDMMSQQGKNSHSAWRGRKYELSKGDTLSPCRSWGEQYTVQNFGATPYRRFPHIAQNAKTTSYLPLLTLTRWCITFVARVELIRNVYRSWRRSSAQKLLSDLDIPCRNQGCYEPLTRIGIKVVLLGKGRYQYGVAVRSRRNVLSVSRIEQ